jgi:hypothetical protein
VVVAVVVVVVVVVAVVVAVVVVVVAAAVVVVVRKIANHVQLASLLVGRCARTSTGCTRQVDLHDRAPNYLLRRKERTLPQLLQVYEVFIHQYEVFLFEYSSLVAVHLLWFGLCAAQAWLLRSLVARLWLLLATAFGTLCHSIC